MVGLFADNSAPLYSLPFVGPAIDAALQDAQMTFPNVHLTYVILQQENITTCADLAANIDLMAKFYHNTWNHKDALLIVQSGKEQNTSSNKFAKTSLLY